MRMIGFTGPNGNDPSEIEPGQTYTSRRGLLLSLSWSWWDFRIWNVKEVPHPEKILLLPRKL